jgi:hypothetical protein
MEAEVDNQVAAPAEMSTPNSHGAKSLKKSADGRMEKAGESSLFFFFLVQLVLLSRAASVAMEGLEPTKIPSRSHRARIGAKFSRL